MPVRPICPSSPTLVMLTPGGLVVILAVLTGESEVLVDVELAEARVAGSEDGKPHDDT